MGDLKEGAEEPVPPHEHNMDGERFSKEAQADGLSQRLFEGV